MTDFLDEKRQEITDRLKELKPLVDEYNRLEAAAIGPGRRGRIGCRRRRDSRHLAVAADRDARAARSAAPERAAATAHSKTETQTRRRKPGRPPGRRRAGRRKGSGTRAAEALSFVQGQPGITIPELAAKMGIKQNYLYRVLPGLEQEGKVAKKGRGWYPKA